MFSSTSLFAQYCDSTVPSFIVDLSPSPNYNWISPPVQRNGNCCGTTNPDNCLEFVITLNPLAIAVTFNIASGAVPPGALYYQIDCGPPTQVGEPICLTGVGPHHLTFCKPGNNINTFSIVSYSSPIIGPDITLNAGCQGFIYGNYYNESTINWTSIGPGALGAYDYLLSCNSGCDTTYVIAPFNGPSYIDYLVCGMDVGGCDSLPICDTVRVNFVVPVDVTINALDVLLCAGSTTTLMANTSGGSAPYTYLWSTGATTNSIVAGPGIYFIEVLDTSTCFTATDTITITQFAVPPVVAGIDQIACEGSAITLNGAGAVSYVWNNGITDGIPFGQALGTVTYTVIGTDVNGCQNTDLVDVTINALPIVGAGLPQTVCFGTTVTLNGSGAIGYIWDNGVVDGVPFIQAVGTVTYSIIGTDVYGCSNNDQVDVTVNPLPVIVAGVDQTLCSGTVVTLNASGANGYVWDNGIIDGVPFVPAVGTLTYTVTGTDANSCQNIDQIDVVVNPLPVVSAGPDQIVCEGTAVTLTATGATFIIWDNNVLNGVPFVPGVGSFIYSTIGTDLNECENADQVNVIVNPNPIVNAGPDQEVCEGIPVSLFAEGTPDLYWNNGVINGVSFIQQVGVLSYIVSDSYNTGCTAHDTVIIEVYPLPIITAPDVEICEGDGVILTAQGGSLYNWSGGISNGIEFFPTNSESFLVVGISADGCKSEANSMVIVHPKPVASFIINDLSLTTANPTTGFSNLSSGAISYSWDFGDGTQNNSEFEPVHTFPTNEAGEYEIILTAISEYGCEDQAIKYIHVFQDYTIFVPNSFTPDHNGVNEVFFPVMTGFAEDDYALYIFNRWGDLIYESHDMQVGWDGTFAGQDFQVQDGAYTWKIVARIKDSSDTKIFVGHVVLLQ